MATEIINGPTRSWSQAELDKIAKGDISDPEVACLVTLFGNAGTYSTKEIRLFHSVRGRLKTYRADFRQSRHETFEFQATDDERALWFLDLTMRGNLIQLYEVITSFRMIALTKQGRLR